MFRLILLNIQYFPKNYPGILILNNHLLGYGKYEQI